ncbi:MAG: hypothetical protein IRY99_08165 [Isosphaeraceae bacterium]|nr:hypothetical protein [Isosphaeraceae bacterium]
MPRTSRWPAAAVGLVLAILAVVGCQSRSAQAPKGEVGVAPSVPNAPNGAKGTANHNKPFADWPTPKAALIVSGEMLGYLDPCGCTQGQKGGLRRRMMLVEWLRQQGWPLALIDLGSLINDPSTHGGPEETKIRHSVALKALELLQYDALAFSANDLKLGVMEVLGQYLQLGDRPKVVVANVVPEPALGLGSKFVPSLRIAAGPVQVGVTAVLDPAALDAINDPDKAALLAVKPAEEVLPAVLADLEKDTGVQVLMVQGPPEVARRLAKTHPGFDLVVSTSPVPDPSKDQESLNDGKTLLVMVGHKGQAIGVVGIFDDAPRFRFHRHTLTDRYDKSPELARLGEPMRQLIDEEFPSILKVAGVLEKYLKRPYVDPYTGAPSDAIYVGAETCKVCHPGTYEHWRNTGHARAYRGLTQKGRNREWDAECVRCHTTGFEYLGGYTTPEQTPFLKGNQCENCHGPGSKHAADPDNKALLQAVARSAADWERNHRCLQCHDEDNDTDFKFERDWPEIEHNDLDDYSDPKVHQGITPEQLARQGG